MIELKKTPLIITFSLSVLMSQPANDVYYVRYFESDHNFKADLSMLSTDRRGRSHLSVSYNEKDCLLYTSPSPRDKRQSRMPSSA